MLRVFFVLELKGVRGIIVNGFKGWINGLLIVVVRRDAD